MDLSTESDLFWSHGNGIYTLVKFAIARGEEFSLSQTHSSKFLIDFSSHR